jgi:uncharacterized protein (DUF433 family)
MLATAIVGNYVRIVQARICMALGISYPHIEKPEGEPARLARVPRIRVAQIVMDYLAHGWSPDEMCRNHPYLTLAEVHAAMVYYFDHQDEIDREIQADWLAADQERAQAAPSAFVARMRAKGLL